ncbi:MAG: hypothetical protein R3F43_18870 [bacterium]
MTDVDGCESAARLVLSTAAARAIQVQLTWRDEGVPAGGPGSDVDLHVVHPDGELAGRLDCNASNPTPDWGPPGPEGDPVLDVDDRDGDGPENIVIERPEDTGGRAYRVGAVLEERAEGSASVTATIRVFVAGALVFEASQVLPRRSEVWWAAEITWPGGQVREPTP